MKSRLIWGIGGFTLAIIALFGLAKVEAGKALLKILFPEIPNSGGSGSPIRVVGGSLRISSVGGWTTDTDKQLVVSNADTRVLQLANVAGSRKGTPSIQEYPAGILGALWTVTEYVRPEKEKQRGLIITGANPDSTGTAGTLTVDLVDTKKDSFMKDSADPAKRRFSHGDKATHCAAHPEDCERADVILVDTGSNTDTWYCLAPDGTCDINIGNQPINVRKK